MFFHFRCRYGKALGSSWASASSTFVNAFWVFLTATTNCSFPPFRETVFGFLEAKSRETIPGFLWTIEYPSGCGEDDFMVTVNRWSGMDESKTTELTASRKAQKGMACVGCNTYIIEANFPSSNRHDWRVFFCITDLLALWPHAHLWSHVLMFFIWYH